jgi:pSer/pThr/pTyr-binding forkhead associated (FHA) protein
MAAMLLNLTGQNFQTTRDHIGYLIALGLLERQPGKSLRVALPDAAAAAFHPALGAAAVALPEVARALAAATPAGASDPSEEATLNLRPVQAMQQPVAAEPRHHLVIVQPASAVRRVALPPGSLTIGRAAPSALLLEGAEVSRVHCRVDVDGDQVSVTDLNSTNGTFIGDERLSGSAALPHGALLRIGNYVLSCEYQTASQAEMADSTRRKATAQRPR